MIAYRISFLNANIMVPVQKKIKTGSGSHRFAVNSSRELPPATGSGSVRGLSVNIWTGPDWTGASLTNI